MKKLSFVLAFALVGFVAFAPSLYAGEDPFLLPSVQNMGKPAVTSFGNKDASGFQPVVIGGGAGAANNFVIPVKTKTGLNIGVQGYASQIDRVGTPHQFVGGKLGFYVAGTMAFGHGYFARLGGRYAFGNEDQNGTSLNIYRREWTGEPRIAIGRDISVTDNLVIAPYSGFGYRYDYLAPVMQGNVLSANAHAIEDSILYVPVGMTARMRVSDGARISTTLEYDRVINGTHLANYSAAGTKLPNVSFATRTGDGAKAKVLFETKWFGFGPFMNYWNIDASDAKSIPALVCPTIGLKAPCTAILPSHDTLEYGLEFALNF